MKDNKLDFASESQQWEKYYYDLNTKVKNQREFIKKMDDRQSKMRMKSFESELDMKIMHKVQQKKMIEYQKSMANNVLPKTDRFYQRMIKRDEEEILKQEEKLYLGHFKIGYGVKQDMYY